MDKLFVEVLANREQFRRAATEWDAALMGSSQISLFMSHNWLSSWLAAFAETKELRILIARDTSGITGLCPLELGQSKFGFIYVNCLRLLTNEYSSRSDIIVLRRVEETVRALMQEMNTLSWKVFHSGIVLDSSSGIPAIANQTCPLFSSIVKRQACEIPRIHVSGSWEVYLKQKSGNFRRSVKRNSKLIDSLNISWSCKIELDVLFHDIFTISEKTWKHQEGTSLARSVKAWRFYRTIMEIAHHDDHLSYMLMYDQSKPVAFIFGVRYGDTLYALKMGYDENISKAGPGFNILGRFIQHAFLNPNTKWVDLDCIADRGDYKRRWATHMEHASDYYFFRNNVTASGLALVYKGMKKFNTLIKREK